VFGGNGMDKNIETYIDQIVAELNCSENEKIEIKDEMKDHLSLLKKEYLEQGLSDEEASQKALKVFGEQGQLRNGYQESLFPYYKIFKIGTRVLFGLYAVIVLFALLFQRLVMRLFDYVNVVFYDHSAYNRYFFYPPDTNRFFDLDVWQLNSNLIPMQNTIQYIKGTERFEIEIILHNTLGNILIFLPLGIFLPILFKKFNSLSKVFVSSILISFTIEVLQFVLQIGQFDIDDILLNTVGAIIGFSLIKFLIRNTKFANKSYLERTTT
jgi:glycopeptide antibiotics resistance protein